MSISHNTLLDDSRSAYSYKHLIGNMGYWGIFNKCRQKLKKNNPFMRNINSLLFPTSSHYFPLVPTSSPLVPHLLLLVLN